LSISCGNFGIFCGIWYISPRFGMLRMYEEKSCYPV
jgi:hypothetical protein